MARRAVQGRQGITPRARQPAIRPAGKDQKDGTAGPSQRHCAPPRCERGEWQPSQSPTRPPRP
eukprot:8793997-Alexandrium_andersonii.AAC.1